MSCREWKVIKLVSACTKIGSGITPRGGNKVYREQGVSLIRSQNIYDYSFDYSGLAYISNEQANKMKNVEVVREDVLLNITGDSVARCCMVPEQVLPARVNQHVSIIRTRKDVLNPKYLLYWINSYSTKELLLSLASAGGTRKALTKSMIENLEVNMPSIKEQVAISETLSCLDDMIELNNRTNRVLEEMAQAIFKHWFVDFEFPNKDGQPYKSSGGAMDNSELGEIPAGWNIYNLSEIFEINPSRRIPRGTIAPYLDMSNMPTQGHAPKSWINRRVGSGMKFINGDTLVARITPCLENGKTAYVDFLEEDQAGWGSTEYIVLRPRSLFSTIFAYILARSERFREYAIKRMTGSSGRQRVSANDIGQFKITLPPMEHETHNVYRMVIESMFDSMRKSNEESRTLNQLRDTLLPKLMSGEIRVPVEGVV